MQYMKQKIYQIDAFATKTFTGNPAMVCPLERWLSDELMQKIAEENNLSETAFFVKEDEVYNLRWFTPTTEVEEIGFTFLAKSWQKSYVNTEAKLLLLTYAFEEMKFNRVELLTDFLNHTSGNAILRLGAKQEGVLRNHMVMPNGRVRDSVIFSIIDNEWLGVKEHLGFRLKNFEMKA